MPKDEHIVGAGISCISLQSDFIIITKKHSQEIAQRGNTGYLKPFLSGVIVFFFFFKKRHLWCQAPWVVRLLMMIIIKGTLIITKGQDEKDS